MSTSTIPQISRSVTIVVPRCLLGGEVQLEAPVLLRYEFANLLVKAHRRWERSLDPAQAVEALEIFLEYPIIYHSTTTEPVPFFNP